MEQKNFRKNRSRRRSPERRHSKRSSSSSDSGNTRMKRRAFSTASRTSSLDAQPGSSQLNIPRPSIRTYENYRRLEEGHDDREIIKAMSSYCEEDLNELRSGNNGRIQSDHDSMDGNVSNVSTEGTMDWEERMSDFSERDTSDYSRSSVSTSSDSNDNQNGDALETSNNATVVSTGKPSNVIMISGMPLTINESDLRFEVMKSGLAPRCIRILKDKDGRYSRGFAFVEFTITADAFKWMDMNRGKLILAGRNCSMRYSDTHVKDKTRSCEDWICYNCNYKNFKKRVKCYKCSSQKDGISTHTCVDETTIFATKTIMLKNLDPRITEYQVLSSLEPLLPDMMKVISAVGIGKHPSTGTSRGVCYLATDTIEDSKRLYFAIISSLPLNIANSYVTVSYCKYHMGDQNLPYNLMQAPESAVGHTSSYQRTYQQPAYGECSSGVVSTPTNTIMLLLDRQDDSSDD